MARVELQTAADAAQARLDGVVAQLGLFDRTKLAPREIAHVVEYGPIVHASDDGATLYTINGSYLNRWRRTPKGWDCDDCRPTGNGHDGLYTLTIAQAMDRAERWHKEGYALDEDEVAVAPPPPRTKADKAPPTFERALTQRQRGLLERFTIADNRAVFDGSDHVPDWAEVRKVFVALGAKWAKGSFRFPADVDGAAKVRMAIDTGAILDPRLAGFFPTPTELAARMVGMARVGPGNRVLEPSAGRGAIALELRKAGATVVCVEPLADNARALREAGFEVQETRFQDVGCVPVFDAVVMNPPFSSDDEGDIGHVLQALLHVRPGGRLVAILSAGARYRTTAKHEAFRLQVSKLDATWEDIPAGAFAASGTEVATCLLSVRVPEGGAS